MKGYFYNITMVTQKSHFLSCFTFITKKQYDVMSILIVNVKIHSINMLLNYNFVLV